MLKDQNTLVMFCMCNKYIDNTLKKSKRCKQDITYIIVLVFDLLSAVEEFVDESVVSIGYMFKHSCSFHKLPTTPICETTNYIVNIAIHSQWFITS